ncbi:MAG TPA: hypothetical protein VGU03_12905 [Frateuria sp.]|uniref:hypothetical protein n=1 Tax=Frateuria sp. TaxID=2211372 RepID=UPI002DE4B626|nr:hypothetical protein [Frateuria sp.]
MKKLMVLLAIIVVAGLLIFGFNYASVGEKLVTVIHDDPRNSGVDLNAHFDYYLNPGVLVLDMRSIGSNNSMADVFRVMIQLSHSLQSKQFRTVKLEWHGQERYELNWSDFQELGTALDGQNPMYVMRTFPEKLMLPDGTHAFGTWTGGLLGVLGHQMEDFNKFHHGWYLDSMMSAEGM